MAAPRPLLSAAIIVKDEADFLTTCLSSIADVCDEIVVVDTGSTDASIDVARGFGAVQGVRPWDGDFAAARNTALDLATGEWVLYIDADESLEPTDASAMRAELRAAADAVALRVWFRVRPVWSPYREYRLWRHRPDIRFVGRIHETMVPDILRIADDEVLAIRDTDLFRLEHHGYEGDQTAKHLRNLPLLEARVQETPDRCYLWQHLGKIRQDLGDVAGAQAAYVVGIDKIRSHGVRDRTDVLCYGSYALSLIAQGRDVQDLVDEMQRVCPWYHTLEWVAAKNHAAQGRYRDAVAPLERLIAIGPDPLDSSLSYNNSLFTDWAWDLLAECQLALGDVVGAAATMSTASAARPDDLGYRTKATALAGRVARR